MKSSSTFGFGLGLFVTRTKRTADRFSLGLTVFVELSLGLNVLDLVSQVRDVVLMNVYLDLGNSGGSGFWNGGYMSQLREMGRLVYEQPGYEVDGSYHS
jgi:hypothetical protein